MFKNRMFYIYGGETENEKNSKIYVGTYSKTVIISWRENWKLNISVFVI